MCYFKNVILFCSHHKNFVQDYFLEFVNAQNPPPHHVNWFIFCFIKDLIGLLYFQIPAQTWEILEEGLNPAMDLKTPCTSVCRHVFMGVYWKLNKANSRWGGFGILKISILNQLLTMLEPSTLVSVANVQPTKQPFLDRATRTDFL